MKLVILSGLSGSGKTEALHTLEDEGYYCVDNLPLSLLARLLEDLKQDEPYIGQRIAVGIDARTSTVDFADFADYLTKLRQQIADVQLIFLYASKIVLVRRFSANRRRHPLSHTGLPLSEAIQAEERLLRDMRENADWVIDTSTCTIHDLRRLIATRLGHARQSNSLSILFQSFGFKYGVPSDTDFIFDVRCLPNPHWDQNLRPLTGRDAAVREFLKNQPKVVEMLESVQQFLNQWIPEYTAEKRRYITVSIGCNGGQHRSVYLCEELMRYFQTKFHNIAVRHRDINI